uniref:Uncharacterized protein n=1 Tax=Euplotes harpa TaxID=151035 RepID=A0A7S3J5P1_9SPIT|mmetsp:Transcript_16425/g.18987  ORF Transcript_16425/g.18987 Transcript_16425/m.18987 type:complete len:114 (+) Transcript_16425:771-1112(+)
MQQEATLFFDKRNKQGVGMEAMAGLNTSTGAVVPGKHGKKHRGKSKVNQLLPNVSFENETISTSSRVYENRDKTQIEGDKRSNTPFRVKGNKGVKNNKTISGVSLPPMHTKKH